MRIRKPEGWPKLLRAKRLSAGSFAYYWAPPTWAQKRGCPVPAQALGVDFVQAKQRCDTVLNPQFDLWRTGGEEANAITTTHGTFDWMVGIYKSSPKYKKLQPTTRKSFDAALTLVSDYKLKDGRSIGMMRLASITPGVADRIHERLLAAPNGTRRDRTALLAMQASRRAWYVSYRDRPESVPPQNPFSKMGISYSAKRTRPVTYDELIRFVDSADKAGLASIGTAAMIAFFWLQRQTDILNRLTWGFYRPNDAPDCARIFHHKTKVAYDLPLFDEDGSDLWPELSNRLEKIPRNGTLIVTRDQPDRRRKVHLPWQEDHFRHSIAKIRELAGLDESVKFMGLRHGGNVEGANAGLTDAQLRSLSWHKTTAALLRYAQVTPNQQRAAARLRRNVRTKKGNLSE